MALFGAGKPDRAVPLGLGPRGLLPNLNDVVIFILMAGAFVLSAHGAHEMGASLTKLDIAPVTLDRPNLPEYALRTTLRMFAAICASLILRSSSRRWRRRAGKRSWSSCRPSTSCSRCRCSAFSRSPSSSSWSSVRSQLGRNARNLRHLHQPGLEHGVQLHQALRMVPSDLDEASRQFRLSAWLRFWRLEAPFAAPGLIWNAMMSMSGGWFFVVASEAITVGDTTSKLPGIGSWLAVAIERRDIGAVGLAVAAMAVVILIYDQLVFRPIVAWADKFRFEQTAAQQRPRSWAFDLVRRGRLIKRVFAPVAWLAARSLRIRLASRPAMDRPSASPVTSET